MVMSDSFSVGISCDNNRLHSKIVLTSEFETQPDYFFNIIMNDKIIHRSGWTTEDTYSFEMKERGEYKVQGHIKYEGTNIWKRSSSITFNEGHNNFTQKDLKVALEEKESKLVCKIVGMGDSSQQYCFYLLRYGVIIEKTSWQTSQFIHWDIEPLDSGIYVVQGFMKHNDLRVNTFSNPIFVMKRKIGDDMERYMSDSEISDFKMPNVPESHYPFSKFLIHMTERQDIGSELLLSSPSFHYTKLSGGDFKNNFHILHDSPINDFGDEKFIFSGTAKCNGDFVFGADDVQHLNPHDIVDTIGNHSLVIINSKGAIEIHNDLFGIQHHYYLKKDEEIIISNNLFLLMDYASSNKMEMELNWEKMASDFCFIHVQPFHQNFSTSMNIHGLKQQKSDEIIELSDIVNFSKSRLNEIFTEAHSFETKDYEKYINSAAQEIVENIRIVYNHPRFEEIMIDLSGGLDSRTVFAAVTNIPDVKNKITLNCRHSELVPNDLSIASELNVKYNYPWNNSRRTYFWHPPSSIYAYQFGVYYSHRTSIGFRKYPKHHIRLNGMYGEVTARPYYPRKMIRNLESYEDVPEFVEGYFKKISQFSLLSTGTYGFGSAQRYFAQELEGNPGRGPLEKFDLHYLFFRAGLHCSETWRTYIKGAEWGPLQSEKLFIAKYGTFEDNVLPKVQIDVIKNLNADLLETPFGGEQDNLDYSELRNEKLNPVNLSTDSFSNEDMLEKWKINEKEKKNNYEWREYELRDWRSDKDLPLLFSPKYDQQNGEDEIYDEREMLCYLYKNSTPIFREKVIIPLMTFVNSKELSRRDVSLKNKLITACMFVKFLELSKRNSP